MFSSAFCFSPVDAYIRDKTIFKNLSAIIEPSGTKATVNAVYASPCNASADFFESAIASFKLLGTFPAIAGCPMFIPVSKLLISILVIVPVATIADYSCYSDYTDYCGKLQAGGTIAYHIISNLDTPYQSTFSRH